MREKKDDGSDRRGWASCSSEVWSLNLSAWSKARQVAAASTDGGLEVEMGDG